MNLPEKPYRSFGKRLRDAMEGVGLSGKDLAVRVGVRPPTVSEWRAGSYMPDDDRLKKVAELISVSPEWLRYGPTTVRGRASGVVKRHRDPVDQVIQAGQNEQQRWVREFAARVLEASALKLRSLPDDITLEDIEGDERAAEELEEKLRQGKAVLEKSKKTQKRAAG